MGTKQIIPCAICSHPQYVDLEKFYTILSAATQTPIEEIRSNSYDFICFDCTNTTTYQNDYITHKAHAVLRKEAAIIYN